VGIAVGDFLSHGRPDILVAKSDGTVNVLANNGNGTFQSPIVSQFGSSSIGSPKVADLFGDGKLTYVAHLVQKQTIFDAVSCKSLGFLVVETRFWRCSGNLPP